MLLLPSPTQCSTQASLSQISHTKTDIQSKHNKNNKPQKNEPEEEGQHKCQDLRFL
jgi:hypothetical protein